LLTFGLALTWLELSDTIVTSILLIFSQFCIIVKSLKDLILEPDSYKINVPLKLQIKYSLNTNNMDAWNKEMQIKVL